MSKTAEGSVARVVADAARLGLGVEIPRMENAWTAQEAAAVCG